MQSHSAREAAENRGPTVVATTGTFTILSALIVMVRIYSKTTILKRMHSDDWAIIAAIIISIANFVVVIESVHYGTGRHKFTLTKADVLPSQILRYVTHIDYPLMTGLVKASLCLQYLRLFHNLRKVLIGTLAFVIAMTIAVTLVTIFECNPVASVYNPAAYPGYTCINNVTFTNAAAALSVITDIWIVILPIPTVVKLKIQKRNKIVLVTLFSLGVFACIAGAVRLAYLQTLWTSTDPSWDTFGVSITSGIEVGLAIFASSVPGTKPIFDKLFPKLFPSAYGSGSKKLTAQQRVYDDSSRKTSIPLTSFTAVDISGKVSNDIGVVGQYRESCIGRSGEEGELESQQNGITRIYTSEDEDGR